MRLEVKESEMKSMLSISTDPQAVIEVRKSIMEILNARADQETIRLALTTLKESVSPHDIAITNCMFYGGDAPKPAVKK